MPQAAKLLAFLAYLDYQDIWHDLLWVGSVTDRPQWFADLIRDEFLFKQAHDNVGEVLPDREPPLDGVVQSSRVRSRLDSERP